MVLPPSGQRYVPRELVDAVIDELSGDPASLLTCALVHSAWCIRAQYHLFREITLSLVASPLAQPDKQQRILRFAASVNTNRALAYLVHSLTIQGYDDDSDWESAIQDTASLEIRCNALACIVPLLQRPHRVILESLFEATGWGSLPSPLQRSLFELISQPSVTELALLSVEGIPLLPVLWSHHCKSLELRDVVPDQAELDAPFPLNARLEVGNNAPGRRSPTCGLVLDNDDDSLILRYWLAGDVSWLSSLTSLLLGSSAWNDPYTSPHLLQLFDLVRGTLDTYGVKQVAFLELQEPQSERATPCNKLPIITDRSSPDLVISASLLRLDLIPNLQNLSFDLNWYYIEEIAEQRSVMSDIAEALKLLAVPGNVLRTFQITITFEHPDDPDDGFQISLPLRWVEQWVALDDILSSPHFLSLKPKAVGEDIISSKASVILNFDEVKCKNLPSTAGHTDAFIESLENMKTLQVTRCVRLFLN
jgi:hypothetical protein